MSDEDLRAAWRRAQQAGHTIGDVFVRAVADGEDPAQLLVAACRAAPERFIHIEARSNLVTPVPAAVCECDEAGRLPGRPAGLHVVPHADIARMSTDSPPACLACTHMLVTLMRRECDVDRCPDCEHHWEDHPERSVCGTCPDCSHSWLYHDAIRAGCGLVMRRDLPHDAEGRCVCARRRPRLGPPRDLRLPMSFTG